MFHLLHNIQHFPVFFFTQITSQLNRFNCIFFAGSVKEAEEYDNLPPEEAKLRLKLLLEKMDLNRDQQIDRQELKAWIIRSFRMLSEEEARERLEEVDENGDGKVTWAEYAADAYGKDSMEAFDLPDEEKVCSEQFLLQ